MKIKHYTIPIFIPQLACPFQCVFCSQQKITDRVHIPDIQEVKTTIENHLSTFPKGENHIEIGFFGGTFTGLSSDQQEKFLHVAKFYVNRGAVQGIRLSTRPDYINEPVLKLLKDYSVTTIELGAQSMDEEILALSARGHTAKDTEKASKMIIDHGIRLGLQMMIGLKGDTLDKAIFTARKIIELGARETRIYPVLVIRGTKMEEWYIKGDYRPLSIEETIEWLKAILPVFEEAGVEVTRVGLHSSQGFLSGKELVAGPFHTSIRELAMTEVWWHRLQELPEKYSTGKINISIHPAQYNFAIGYYGRNRKKLLKNFSSVFFVKDIGMKENEFHVDHH